MNQTNRLRANAMIKDARSLYMWGSENKTKGLASTVHLYMLVSKRCRFTGARTVMIIIDLFGWIATNQNPVLQPQYECRATIAVTCRRIETKLKLLYLLLYIFLIPRLYTVAQPLATSQLTTAPTTLPPTLSHSYRILTATANNVIQSAVSHQFAKIYSVHQIKWLAHVMSMCRPLSVGHARPTVCRWFRESSPTDTSMDRSDTLSDTPIDYGYINGPSAGEVRRTVHPCTRHIAVIYM